MEASLENLDDSKKEYFIFNKILNYIIVNKKDNYILKNIFNLFDVDENQTKKKKGKKNLNKL